MGIDADEETMTGFGMLFDDSAGGALTVGCGRDSEIGAAGLGFEAGAGAGDDEASSPL